MRIHYQQSVSHLKDCRIAVDERGRPPDCRVDPIRDFLDVKKGRQPRIRLRPRLRRAEHGLFQQGGARPVGTKRPPEKSASV